MIAETIKLLRERSGSSSVAIAKAMGEKYGLAEGFKTKLSTQLKRLAADGRLVMVRPLGTRPLTPAHFVVVPLLCQPVHHTSPGSQRWAELRNRTHWHSPGEAQLQARRAPQGEAGQAA
jgi:hypothetical protein